MIAREFELPAGDIKLKGTAWLPDRPRAILLVEHGMAEHHLRYADFATYLAERGIAVYSYDKRGHGKTAGLPDSPAWRQNAGWFARKDGWKTVVRDSLAVLGYIRRGGVDAVLCPGTLPLFLMGHSMGSMVVRSVVAEPDCAAIGLAGLVVSGTAGPPGPAGAVGKALAAALAKLRGHDAPSPFLDRLVSGGHARLATGEKNPRNPFEWLSRDPVQVDRYIADPYCGFVMGASFYRDLVAGLSGLSTADYARRFPRGLPVLLFSGDRDPVGGMGKGVTAVHEDYKDWGVADLSFKLFPGSRHEMLNETNRLEVFDLVSGWLEVRIPR
jgi:alpha-beta hydrolase superfamily lysophospholipase